MGTRRWSNKFVSASSVLLGAGLVLSASAADVAARPIVNFEQALFAPIGAGAAPVGNELGSHSSISGDGRFVVYQGNPAAPANEDDPVDPREHTIYLSNREDGVTTELTPVPDGLRPGNSVRPVISGDGCTVFTVTEMNLDVFRDDDGGERWDLYKSTLPHCEGTIGSWELVSARTDGTGLARDDVRPDQTPAVSRAGTEVLYVHPADHLFEADGVLATSIVDLTIPATDAGRSRFVTGMPGDSPNTTFVHVGIDQPAISDDGRYVVYRSDAASNEGVPVWGTGDVDGERAIQQVFVWDRTELDPFAAVQLVSTLPSGAPSLAGAAEPTISRTGRVIAFTSSDAEIVPSIFPSCTTACPSQVFVLDRDGDNNAIFDEAGTTTMQLVSSVPESDPAIAGTAPSSQPALNADGKLVAFVSRAPNLQLIQAPGGGEESDGDVLVADRGSDLLRRITVSNDGIRPTIGAHARPSLSDTGRVTVFDTLAAAQLLDDGAAPGRQVVALSAPPRLSLADADVGTTIVGSESAGWFVGLVNDGPSAFDPAVVTISDGRFAIDEQNSTCVIGTLVPSGSSCQVWFTFTPSSNSAVNATLTVAEEGFEALSIESQLAGAGGEPTLQINPGGGDFGSHTVGDVSNEFLFDVSNISLIPSSISRVSISGAHPDDFTVTTNSCADRPLNPRASCAVGVRFNPTEAGRRTALIEAVTPQGQFTSIILAGDASFAPKLQLIDDTVLAGDQILVGGNDYRPNTEVTVVFGDGAADTVTTTTNENGDFVVNVPVAQNERGGDRTIVVQSTDGAAASAPVEVIEEQNQLVGMPGFGLG